jgi:hypothetical protein
MNHGDNTHGDSRRQQKGPHMGMDLYNGSSDFWFSMSAWPKVLQLGRMGGWQPAGTLAPDWEYVGGSPPDAPRCCDIYKDWGGDYCFNEHQTVTAEDARSLADALEKMLDDIPNHDVIAHKTVKIESAGKQIGRGIAEGVEVSPIEWFGGHKKRLRDFIVFCRQGRFHIG